MIPCCIILLWYYISICLKNICFDIKKDKSNHILDIETLSPNIKYIFKTDYVYCITCTCYATVSHTKDNGFEKIFQKIIWSNFLLFLNSVWELAWVAVEIQCLYEMSSSTPDHWSCIWSCMTNLIISMFQLSTFLL